MLYVYGAVALLIAGLFGWGSWERGEAIRHQHRAAAAEAIAQSQAAQIGALERLQAETAARAARGNQIRRDINAAPNGTACAASGPVRAVLGGLRATTPPAGDQPRAPDVRGSALRS